MTDTSNEIGEQPTRQSKKLYYGLFVFFLLIGAGFLFFPASQQNVQGYRYCGSLLNWDFNTDNSFSQYVTSPSSMDRVITQHVGTWAWEQNKPTIIWEELPTPTITRLLAGGRIMMGATHVNNGNSIREINLLIVRCGASPN